MSKLYHLKAKPRTVSYSRISKITKVKVTKQSESFLSFSWIRKGELFCITYQNKHKIKPLPKYRVRTLSKKNILDPAHYVMAALEPFIEIVAYCQCKMAYKIKVSDFFFFLIFKNNAKSQHLLFSKYYEKNCSINEMQVYTTSAKEMRPVKRIRIQYINESETSVLLL